MKCYVGYLGKKSYDIQRVMSFSIVTALGHCPRIVSQFLDFFSWIWIAFFLSHRNGSVPSQQIAERLGLQHESVGVGPDRRVIVQKSKNVPTEPLDLVAAEGSDVPADSNAAEGKSGTKPDPMGRTDWINLHNSTRLRRRSSEPSGARWNGRCHGRWVLSRSHHLDRPPAARRKEKENTGQLSDPSDFYDLCDLNDFRDFHDLKDLKDLCALYELYGLSCSRFYQVPPGFFLMGPENVSLLYVWP